MLKPKTIEDLLDVNTRYYLDQTELIEDMAKRILALEERDKP